jgi:putative FmdB family regulatory protein
MPIYTYRCENCGVQFEQQQSFNDEPLKRCPECKKNKLRRVITPAGIVFKGSGWYVNDNKSGSKSASKPAPVKAGTETKGETKSEGKESAPAASTSAASDSGTSGKSDSGGSKSNSSGE